MKTYALRKTLKGYMLTEIELQKDFHGNMRKYAHDYERLIYKKKEFAEQKAKSFFSYWMGETKYMGVIKENEYRGELV